MLESIGESLAASKYIYGSFTHENFAVKGFETVFLGKKNPKSVSKPERETQRLVSVLEMVKRVSVKNRERELS